MTKKNANVYRPTQLEIKVVHAKNDKLGVYNCHDPVVLQLNMTMRHQDTSVSRLAFHSSKHHKQTLAPLRM